MGLATACTTQLTSTQKMAVTTAVLLMCCGVFTLDLFLCFECKYESESIKDSDFFPPSIVMTAFAVLPQL